MSQHCASQDSWYYPKAIIIFLLMALFLCFEMALQVSPGVMAEQLRNSLHLTAFGLGIMSGVYFVTYTIMQIPSGLMYDRTNFRVLVTVAILICAAGIGIFGFSSGIISGSLARLLMGFGSAFAFLSVLTVAARYFPPAYFAMLTGIAQLLAAIGGIVGNIPIAWSTDQFGWRQTLWWLMVIGVFLAAIIWFFVRKPKPAPQSKAEDVEPVMCTLKRIIHQRQTWMAALYAFFNWAPVTAFASLWGVPFLKTAYHLSNTQAGSLCALIWLGIGVASPFVGALSDLIGRRNPMLFSTAVVGAIAVSIVVYVPHLPIWALSLCLFITGIGSSGQILSFAVVKDFTARKRTSTSIGFNNMAVVASGILVQPFVGKLLSLHSAMTAHVSIHHVYAIGDLKAALIILPIFFIICAILSLGIIRETFCGRERI